MILSIQNTFQRIYSINDLMQKRRKSIFNALELRILKYICIFYHFSTLARRRYM